MFPIFFRILTFLNFAFGSYLYFSYVYIPGSNRLRMLGGTCKHFCATNTSYFQRDHKMLEYQVSNYKPANGVLGLDDFQKSVL